MATKGLPKKYAKLGFKKGWAEYKKAKAKQKRERNANKKPVKKKVIKKVAKKQVSKKSSTKKTVKKSTTKKGNTMAKKKSKKSNSPVRRKNQMFGPATQKMLVDGIIIGGTSIGGTLLLTKMKFLENWKPWQKGLALGGASILVFMFLKGKIGKTVALGLAVAGATTAMLPVIQKSFSNTVSGGRRLSPAEMQAITSSTMGRPKTYKTMGRPSAKLKKTETMGRPKNFSNSMAGRRGRY